MCCCRSFFTGLFVFLFAGSVAVAGEISQTSAQRGWRTLTTKAFLPSDFDDDVFNALWKAWPETLRNKAAKADAATRRRMTFARYGILPALPADQQRQPALGYVRRDQEGWAMNCLTCHAGKVAGKTIPGLPNSQLDLQSLVEDVRESKLRMGKRMGHLELAALKLPLGDSLGTTNAVVFGIVLGNLRDKDMRVVLGRGSQTPLHHFMDAPPLWNVKHKSQLYIDGHAPKNHRVLMQFMLLPTNSEAVVKGWEGDFRDILAWIESLEAPRWPWKVDRKLAAQGRVAFNAHCSRCHGTYGEKATYPQRTIPIDEIGTDSLRLRALTREHRRWLKESWMSRYGKDNVITDPIGYVAPPLNGVWASAPYFHNGSVPTLWHVLHPDRRPAVWKRTKDGYDQDKVGLEVTSFDKLPAGVVSRAERRRYFNTHIPGGSPRGHGYPEKLSEAEKRAVLEYLKTL